MNRKRAEYIRNKSEKEVSSGCSSYAVFFFKKVSIVCAVASRCHTLKTFRYVFLYTGSEDLLCVFIVHSTKIISTTKIEIRRLGAFLFQFFFYLLFISDHFVCFCLDRCLYNIFGIREKKAREFPRSVFCVSLFFVLLISTTNWYSKKRKSSV